MDVKRRLHDQQKNKKTNKRIDISILNFEYENDFFDCFWYKDKSSYSIDEPDKKSERDEKRTSNPGVSTTPNNPAVRPRLDVVSFL